MHIHIYIYIRLIAYPLLKLMTTLMSQPSHMTVDYTVESTKAHPLAKTCDIFTISCTHASCSQRDMSE